MYYFIIPNPKPKATTTIVPCYKREDGQWVYKQSVNNVLEDAIVSEKAQIFSVPDSLDELTLLQNAIQTSIAGVVVYAIDNSAFEMVETGVLTDGSIKEIIPLEQQSLYRLWKLLFLLVDQ